MTSKANYLQIIMLSTKPNTAD